MEKIASRVVAQNQNLKIDFHEIGHTEFIKRQENQKPRYAVGSQMSGKNEHWKTN